MSLARFAEAWAAVAGPELAGQTAVTSFRAGVAQIGVGNAVLLHELGGFRRAELLKKMRERLPDLDIHDLRFRAGAL